MTIGTWPHQIGSTELVWHRVNDEADLTAFLASNVRWAECDIRLDPGGEVRVGHEPIDGTVDRMELSDWLDVIRGADRSAKIDLKEGGPVIGSVLRAIARVGSHGGDVWLNAAVEIPGGEAGFTQLADAHPDGRISCPLDTLASYLLVAPPAYDIVELLRSWGINWLCLGSRSPGVALLVTDYRAEDGR